MHVPSVECVEFPSTLPLVQPSLSSSPSPSQRHTYRHSRPQGDIVTALILTSERFYSPNAPGPRRLYTSTGTPLRVNWIKKPTKSRLRSFLWDTQWDDPSLFPEEDISSCRHVRISSDMEVSWPW